MKNGWENQANQVTMILELEEKTAFQLFHKEEKSCRRRICFLQEASIPSFVLYLTHTEAAYPNWQQPTDELLKRNDTREKYNLPLENDGFAIISKEGNQADKEFCHILHPSGLWKFPHPKVQSVQTFWQNSAVYFEKNPLLYSMQNN